MTFSPEHRKLFSLEPTEYARGSRSPRTCHLRCGDACAQPVPNESKNNYFRDVATSSFSRRGVLAGAGVGAAAVAATSMPVAAHPGKAEDRRGGRARNWFTPIEPVANTVDDMTVPDGFYWHTIIKWGDPILAGAPEWDPMNQTAEAQAMQFGYNNDYTDIIPLDRSGKRAVLCCNHEYTNEYIMFPPGMDSEEAKRVAMMAHGFSVVELRRSHKGARWEYQQGAHLNRRITLQTPFAVDGPAAGSDLLKTKDDPTGMTVLGTQNNCAGSTTPWNTILSGEENFNQYFVANDTEENRRYGIPSTERGRMWWTVDPRFDARQPGYENEVNRFGWVVEIDPMDPESTPIKHTALGRFKHEAAAVRMSHNFKAVAYSGDDERFDYLYKFISREHMIKGLDSGWARDHNKKLLSDGDLYVAKFIGDSPESEIDGSGKLPSDGMFDGRGEWIALTKDGKSMVPGMSIEEVLVYTRLAADKMGATKMDRPEDVQPNPVNGRVYIACTNNSNRGKEGYAGVDEANPRTINRTGHVIELMEKYNDAGAMTFYWRIFLMCGDPSTDVATYFGGYTGEVSPISCPDNVAFDSVGNLWVSTDGQPKSIGYNDALHRVPVRGKERGKVEQFLAVPRDAETCGPVIHDREKTVYVAVQHPGENGDWNNPTSLFPEYGKDGAWKGPRPGIVQVSPNS